MEEERYCGTLPRRCRTPIGGATGKPGYVQDGGISMGIGMGMGGWAVSVGMASVYLVAIGLRSSTCGGRSLL